MPVLGLREMGDDDKPRETMTVEISEEEVAKLKIGQAVEVNIKGSVGMLQVPPDGVSEGDPPLLGIRVSSKSVRGKNEFEDLFADEDEED